MNHDSLNEVPGKSIVTSWNPWGFHKTISTLCWTQQSCLQLQVRFRPVLSMFDLEHTPPKTRFSAP
jgi:hypothetical protein